MSMTLEDGAFAAPLFTPENTGRNRRDNFHKDFAATARKRYPGKIVKSPVTSENNKA